jgi:hypothetical protein
MSFVITDTSTVFTNPADVKYLPTGSNPTAVVATTPVQLAGIAQTYTTLATTGGAPAQLVVSGQQTRVNVAPGAALIQATGGGAIIESSIVVGDAAKTIALGNSTVLYNQAVVNTVATVSGNGSGTQTIAQAAGNIPPPAAAPPSQTNPGFAYYAQGGTGNDQIEGSSLNDFIRGGAGNDTINGFGGNDLIRGGAGSDIISFGKDGNDTLYYTSDQLDGSTDTVTDFVSGQDKIAVDKTAVASTANISGLGTSTITFTASGTRVISSSPNSVIKAGDIDFV